MEQNKIKKQEMQAKCNELKRNIEGKKQNSKNRGNSEDIIKKRADRLKKSIAILRKRDARF